MDTKKYEALLASINMGSFTKAAEVLGCTQSGLTHMMNGLEQEFGFQLLIRGHHGVKPTPNCSRILPYIQKLVEANTALDVEIKRVNTMKDSVIRIGSYTSIIMHWLSDAVKKFNTDYPDITVEIKDGGADEIYGWVMDGTVDIGFLSRQEEYKTEWIPLRKDPLLAIMPPDDSHTAKQIPLTDFNGKKFLMPSYGLNKDIYRVFKKYGITPDISNSHMNYVVILSMVERGLGMSILSELLLKGRNDNIKIMDTKPKMYRELGIAIQSHKYATNTVKKFIEYTKETVESLYK
ncbi:MAG: LysR family transcriptional regulator [Clostridiales bacterium]|nr:LysR family transcriptional regulator [Clostridiales bacterium]